MKFWLLLPTAAVLSAAAPAGTPVISETLRYTSSMPSGWEARSGGAELVPKSQPDPQAPYGIDVRFHAGEKDGLAVFLRTKVKARKSLALKKGRTLFTQSSFAQVGDWLVVEISERGAREEALRTMIATRPSYGGFYEAVFSARNPWYPKERDAVIDFLKRFESKKPGLSYRAYTAPGGTYRLTIPDEPWTTSEPEADGTLRVVGPSGREGAGRSVFAVRRFENRGLYRDLDDYLSRITAEASGKKAGGIQVRRFPGGEAKVVEVEESLEALPEAGLRGKTLLKTAYVVFRSQGGFYALSYKAPADSYPEFLAAFEKACASFSAR